jgi:hypothetical protein
MQGVLFRKEEEEEEEEERKKDGKEDEPRKEKFCFGTDLTSSRRSVDPLLNHNAARANRICMTCDDILPCFSLLPLPASPSVPGKNSFLIAVLERVRSELFGFAKLTMMERSTHLMSSQSLESNPSRITL